MDIPMEHDDPSEPRRSITGDEG